MLIDLAPRIMPELDRRLSASATKVLSGRGVDIRTGTSNMQLNITVGEITEGVVIPVY